MAQFYPLTVVDATHDTRDSIVLTLQPPADAADVFHFVQGQYLTFRRDFDGEEIRRSYSICAGVEDGALRVGVKRVEGGAFSTWANETVKVGDTLDAMAPAGRFFVDLDPGAARRYLGFAGGSGVTPMISHVKTILAAEPQARFSLVYGNRNVASIMFREELEDLKNRYMGRFDVTHILESDAADIELFTGRLDSEKCAALFDRWIDVSSADVAFICGPEPMMLAVRDALKARGVADKAIKIELFSGAQQGRAKQRAASRGGDRAAASVSATIILDGVARDVSMSADQSVLSAALEAKIDAPFACKGGVCSTCVARLVEGEVDMEANYALEDYEVERGSILTCQSYPRTEKVVVSYDG
ncbi:MAG: 1,2-phenylacetyl-CoA epoxidase subunit PaaE [Pseudomonadota bacterium]